MTSQTFGKSMLSREMTYSVETTLLSEMACQNLQTTTTVENTAPGVPWEEHIPQPRGVEYMQVSPVPLLVPIPTSTC